MLEWLIEMDHDWKVSPGPYGRRLQRWLRPELWDELQSTYSGISAPEGWNALFGTISLFRKVAVEVGEHLGFPYPYDMDLHTVAYLERIRTLPPDAGPLY
jgi:aminoglycoside 6-adenylyltransferase